MKRTLHIITIAIVALLSATTANAASGIDWTSLPWLGNGSGLPAHTDKYKVSPVVGMQVVNVQKPGFASAVGIYLTIGTQINDCSVANDVQGGGILLHLSAFTAKETEVTINYQSGTESHKCTFWVYYADGSGDAGGSDVDEPETPVESTYCHELLISGNCTIYLTNEKLSENNYRLTIEGENLVDVHNTFYNPAATRLVPTSVTSEKIICDFTATSTPKFYTPLYIKTTTSNEVNFADIQNKDLIWGVCNIEPTPEPIYTSISDAICFGETYTWNGQTYSTAGEYTQEFTAVNGADSIVTLTLTVYPQTQDVTEDATIDFGETYTWHNQEYTATGTYTTTLQDANGCDYQATLNLTVNSNSSSPSTCTYEGGPGDALMEQPGQDQFESGYRITLTLDEADTDKIHITATVFDADAPASTAWFQNYPNYNYSQNTAQHKFAGADQNTFETTISISSLISNREDGIIRFAIKFEYPNGVIKVTTPEFFYLDGSGCAQRVFAIYHHDDVPATPFEGEDQFTEFRGGRILQQIQYKRILRPDTWETFCVPFEVDSVTVYDPDDQQNYHLHAQYNKGGTTVAGHFWLREFTTREVIMDAFQPNWHDITATSQVEALPKKDVPYIIRVPAGDYYTDKYVVFHGKGYQTIASEYDIPTAPADNYFSYSGNNTMMPQTLTSAYVLESAGYYFQANSSGVTLHPFECSVNASATTIARMPRISLNDRERTVTDVQDLPTTDLSDGVIYTVYGAAVAEFHSLEQYDEARAQLPAGVYLVATPTSVIKICVQ